jgi:hypothetical protein
LAGFTLAGLAGLTETTFWKLMIPPYAQLNGCLVLSPEPFGFDTENTRRRS